MALRVWLPLNGNLNNQGLSNITITNNGTTINASGKIGQCYAFDGSQYITITSTDIQDIFQNTTSPFSMACWIYLNSDETDRVILFGNYSANPFVNWELAANCTQRLCVGGTSNYTNKTDSTVVPKETWTHIAVTYDGTNTKFYVNGIFKSTFSGANTLSTKTASSTFWLGSDNRSGATRLKGRMNDFRIYDHCLSVKEVEEIAKGLILHYKLNDNIVSDINSTIIYDVSGYKNDGISNNITIENNTSRYLASSSFNGTNSYIKCNSNNWMVNPTLELTVNLWIKTEASSWPANGGRVLSCTESGGFNLEGGNSGYWRFPVYVYTAADLSTKAYKYDSKEIQISALSISDWNMITLVYDTTGTKTYVNGELHHIYNNTSYGICFNKNAKIFLGCESNTSNGTTPYFQGFESDFRIYCTALTAEQIKELYNTSATIDKSGNVYTREVIE